MSTMKASHPTSDDAETTKPAAARAESMEGVTAGESGNDETNAGGMNATTATITEKAQSGQAEATEKAAAAVPAAASLEDDEMDEDEGPVAKGVSRRPGLPMEVQKQLLIDIEADGGIHTFTVGKKHALRKICDQRPHLYGTRGTKVRRQIGNKVEKWKALPPERYHRLLVKILADSGMPSPVRTSIVGLPFNVQRALIVDLEREGGLKALDEQGQSAVLNRVYTRRPKLYCNDEPNGKRRKQIYNFVTRLRSRSQQEYHALVEKFVTWGTVPQEPESPIRQRQPLFPEAKRQAIKANGAPASFPQLKSLPFTVSEKDQVEVVQVDTLYPEKNGPVQVFPLTNIERNGVLNNGFEVTMEGDLRDVLADNYKAFLVSSNEILVRIPIVSYSFLHDNEHFNKTSKLAMVHCPRTQESHDVTRNRLLLDKASQKKLVLLQFPVDSDLTNKVFSPAATQESPEIEFEVVPITVKVDFHGSTLPMTVTRVSWKVSKLEKEPRLANANETESIPQGKGASKLSHFLSNVNAATASS